VKTFTDQIGKVITIDGIPQRIVSLVPSQTELLADLGLDESVIGITKFCVHPEKWIRTKKRIGGTKKLNIDLIRSLQPDLVIANKEENDKAQVELLSQEFPLWTSDISTLSDAREMIIAIGEITTRIQRAKELIRNIDTAFEELKLSPQHKVGVSAAYIIWNKPFMVAGGDTFISSMMNCAGFKNVFEDQKRYPEVTATMINDRMPELIILSSEPYPFKEKHVEEFSRTFEGSSVVLADGEMFSWYGSRLQHAPAYFRKLFEQIQSYS
jgi:ABC-type Fe3+-hydroxamate transport system substrate-binding protein